MATVIFKPTEACNARCVYCDVVHKESQLARTMPMEILETLFVRVNEFLLERPAEGMEIIWHGGEPLLLGPGYFDAARAFQEKHCGATSHRIRHAIQSNLTLITPELIGALKRLGISSIGSSYDPFCELRGLGPAVDNREYHRRFLDGVALLEQHGMRCGIIYVVHKLSLARPLPIFHHLTNVAIGSAINLNPVIIYDDRLAHLKITPVEFADFLGAIFPVWWRHRERYPNVGPFDAFVRNVLHGEGKLTCGDSGRCMATHVNVAPDGRLSQCGRSFDWGLLDYGSISEKTFSQVFDDPQRKELAGRGEVLRQGECKGCRYWDICHGGCPLDAWYETGDLLRKGFWCRVKSEFIERYFEPTVSGRGAAPLAAVVPAPARAPAEAPPEGEVWINPVGGLGDALMLSGVLKQVVDRDPVRRFRMVKRTKYGPILEGHPAIAGAGHPPPGARFISPAYWMEPGYAAGERAYQVLARMFGLPTPVEESLFVPWPMPDDDGLARFLPPGGRAVAICPTSDSPRKQAAFARWEALVRRLAQAGVTVAQVGRHTDPYVRGAVSLLGLTTTRQLVSLLGRFDAVVTSDNFVMHAARLRRVPAVVLWGPTSHRTYGYPGHRHFQAAPACPSAAEGGCIGNGKGPIYGTPCPQACHCLDTIDMDEVFEAVLGEVEKGARVSSSS